jgi:predicted RNA binding protein YcfA (HicA-like mRNA interferase family)
MVGAGHTSSAPARRPIARHESSMSPRRLLARLLQGHLDNVAFDDFVALVLAFGFQPGRTTGSHRTFGHPGVPELLSLQPRGGDAKPYQVRQLLRLVERYNLRLGNGR